MQQSMFSLAEPPAKVSQSQDSARDWMTRVATWPLSFSRWLIATVPSGSFGKMSPVSCHRQEGGILVPSSGAWSNSGMGSPTESWTLSGSEFHSGAAVCSLSDILETGDLPQRFFLSPKACAGILRRAEKRGKQLPRPLEQALRTVAQDTVRDRETPKTN